jgi:hypothetical protein
MAYELNGSNQYFNTATAPASAEPLTIACWFYANNTTADHTLVSINGTSTLSYFQLQAAGSISGDPVRAVTFAGSGGANVAASTSGFSASTWTHAAGVFTSTSSRTVYLNGTAGNQNTGVSSIPNIVRLSIGVISWNTPVNYLNGRIAEVGVWNVALTAEEIASLADGMTCDKVCPQSLVFYAPLVRNLQDVKGGLTITNNNTATVANHPRVYA